MCVSTHTPSVTERLPGEAVPVSFNPLGIMSTRLDVKKTYKLYIGGKFPRSESGRYLPAKSAQGVHLDNYAHASRKDFREAVVAARAAFGGWSKATAYNRGQILYRAAEMLQNRAGTGGGDRAVHGRKSGEG